VDGVNVSFRAGNGSYSGRINGDTIDLARTLNFPPRPRPSAPPESLRPAVGPAPDGSDPSRSPLFRPPGFVAIVLRRVQR
jgi:beta-galactosidase